MGKDKFIKEFIWGLFHSNRYFRRQDMNYKKAERILPVEVIRLIQNYIDVNVYIFRERKIIVENGEAKLQFVKN